MDNRQKQLLKVIVETYVKSVKPVGSKSLCEKFNLSSATIRNEMAILEDLGYIEKIIYPQEEYLQKKVIVIMLKT